jgi:hypothetical protein
MALLPSTAPQNGLIPNEIARQIAKAIYFKVRFTAELN